MRSKNVLKISLVLLCTLMGLNASAQGYESIDREFVFGIKAGGSLFSASIKDTDNKIKVGYQIGITAEYPIAEDIYLQSGLSVISKGAKWEYDENQVEGGTTITNRIEADMAQMYIQLPVFIAYKIYFTDDGKRFALKVGPYFAYGVGGKTTYEKFAPQSENIPPVSNEIDTFGDNGFKKFDAGVACGIDMELNKIVVGLGYEAGLLNLQRRDGSFRTRGATITLGYLF